MKEQTEKIKNMLLGAGFLAVGISRTAFLENARPILEKWLQNGYHSTMKYMENNLEKRLDPGKLVEGALSVITALDAYPHPGNEEDTNFKISCYAKGKDYHKVVKKRLKAVAEAFSREMDGFSYRVFTDSAPVMDKVWAQRAGLGWIGKNTCLINKSYGSFHFIGHIICNAPFEYDQPFNTNHCGNCSRCIDACPTGAILEPGILDARKCISYLTIENRENSAEDLKGKTAPWIFGCDVCQEVCPWNRKHLFHNKAYEPSGEILSMDKEKWKNLTKEQFERLFRGTAIYRTGFEALKRNIEAADLL